MPRSSSNAQDRSERPVTLPSPLHVMFVTNRRRMASWLVEEFAGNCEAEVILEEVTGAESAIEKLSDAACDVAILVNEKFKLDALGLARTVRDRGCHVPLVVLGESPSSAMNAAVHEAGADGYLCIHAVSPEALCCTLGRSLQRNVLAEESSLQVESLRQRAATDRDDVLRLLDEQRELLASRLGSGQPSSPPSAEAAQRIRDEYRELLRAFVIMGSGCIATDVARIARSMICAGLSLHDATTLHVEVLEGTIRGLGNRSARHIVDRAGLLAIELLAEMGEGFRRAYRDAVVRPRQMELPGLLESGSWWHST